MTEKLEWKVHTHGLFQEIVGCGVSTSIFKHPLNILQRILEEVAVRAVELEDPQLNVLMMRLSLYSISNPDDPEYDPQKVEQYISQVRYSYPTIEEINNRSITEKERKNSAKSLDTYNRLKSKPGDETH
jgi:hypothetical protein